MVNIEKYLTEKKEEDNDADLSPEDSQKVLYLSDIMDVKKKMPIMKKTIAKILAGKQLSEKERSMLKDIMKHFMKPDKNKFRRLLKKF